MNTVLAAVIPPAGPIRVEPIPNDDGDALRAAVGGWFEVVILRGGVRAWLHEEGRLLGLPANPRATAVMHALGWLGGTTGPVVGPVVLTGSAGPEVADLPASADAALAAVSFR